MLDISKHPYLKYALFGDIYFANGIQGAVGIMLLIVYFTEKDISIATATMVGGVASIPFTLKFLFGPLTDRFIKIGRKPFVVIGGTIAGFGLFPLAIIDPKVSLFEFTLSLFIAVVGIVILDVAADAWAIQVTKVHEHGKVNAAMFGSMFGGVAIGLIFLSQVANIYGYNLVYFIGGIIILLTMILPLMVKEEIIIKKHPKIGRLLIKEFKKKKTLIISLFGFLAAMNFGILLFIIPEYMMNVLKLDVAQIGLMSSLFPIGIIIGSVASGIIADKWGRKKTLAISLTGTIIVTSLLIFANTWLILAILYLLIGILQGGATFAALMALFMDITNPKIGGTQYSILTSITNLGDYSMGIVSGSILMFLGYQRFFLYAAWVVGPALIILYFVDEKWEKNR
jgi:MFS transporter, PAT family, beta-lactamase induction signal transducer AmpG